MGDSTAKTNTTTLNWSAIGRLFFSTNYTIFSWNRRTARRIIFVEPIRITENAAHSKIGSARANRITNFRALAHLTRAKRNFAANSGHRASVIEKKQNFRAIQAARQTRRENKLERKQTFKHKAKHCLARIRAVYLNDAAFHCAGISISRRFKTIYLISSQKRLQNTLTLISKRLRKK